MPYTVMVDDNFHYQDESERYEQGTYATLDEAIAVCKRIVDEDLASHLKPGITADQLYDLYVMFDRDPFILGASPSGSVPFSAWDYAKERCEVLAKG
jgi:hypothetical protein